jgi:sulfur carrier protein ThiS
MRLHLGGNLPFFSPGHTANIDISLHKITSLKDILIQIGIPLGEIFLITLNGELISSYDIRVTDSDEVRVYPPIDGGSS